jgi:regulator of sigma E protease
LLLCVFCVFRAPTGAYKQVGGFKAIFDIFPLILVSEVSEHYRFVIDYVWCNELLPIPELDALMWILYEPSVVKPSDKFENVPQMFVAPYYTTVTTANETITAGQL